jgi:DNA gyrase subunit A
MDKIIEQNLLNSYERDAEIYTTSVNFDRITPDYRDGLKVSVRRLLGSLIYHMKREKFIKTQSVIGKTMEISHPHGDQGLQSAVVNSMTDFNINYPLFTGQGNWGNSQGDEEAAPRYTEMRLSEFAIDMFVRDVDVNKNVLDYIETYNRDYQEPEAFASAAPVLLINGHFGIGYGLQVYIPAHNLNEVINATLKLIDDPSAPIVLTPDQLLGSDIIESNFKSISNTGHGSFRVRGKIEIVRDTKKEKTFLVIKSTPDMRTLNNILERIVGLIDAKKLQVVDYKDQSGERDVDLWLELKKGADPEYNREILYKHTDLQMTYTVNMQLLDGLKLDRYSYKGYLLKWIDFRLMTKHRLYTNKLQMLSTNRHEKAGFITVMESGYIDYIIQKIRKGTKQDDLELVEFLIKEIKITEHQALFIINAPLKYLSPTRLDRYKVDQIELSSQIENIKMKLDNEKLLFDEIKNELNGFKVKYGRPRRSKVIPDPATVAVSGGMMQMVITKNNFIKKIDQNLGLGAFANNDAPKFTTLIDNRDSIILFCKNGSIFSIPLSTMPMMDPNTTGVDLRFISKNLTSEVMYVTTDSVINELAKKVRKNYILLLTYNGNIKKVNVKDFMNVSKAGMYAINLENDDYLVDVDFIKDSDIIFIYDREKGLAMNATEIPLQRRHSKGVRSMGNSTGMQGVSISKDADTQGVLIVTRKGYVNRLDIESIKHGKRANVGANFIKLGDGDEIFKVLAYKNPCQTFGYKTTECEIGVPIDTIKIGSSISKGTKLIPSKGVILLDCTIMG